MVRRQPSRSGKIAWKLIAVGAAGIAGATAVGPHLIQEQAIPPQTALVQENRGIDDSIGSIHGGNALVRPQEPSGSGSVLRSSTPSSWSSPSLGTNSSPVGSSDLPHGASSRSPSSGREPIVANDVPNGWTGKLNEDRHASPLTESAASESEAEEIGDGTHSFADAETEEAKLAARQNPFEDTALFRTVRVFYATDRQLVDPYSLMLWVRILLPAMLGLFVCGVTLIGLKWGKTRPVWAGGFTVGVLMTMFFLYHATIYGQQTIRLARNGGVLFGTRRIETLLDYPLHVGFSDVTIPRKHSIGKVERPSIFKVEFTERTDRHVTVRSIQPVSADEYFTQLKETVETSIDKSALVFIHGYNVQFDEALRRTAQLSHDLDFLGAPILYSWPSHGSLTGYRQDEANASWTIAHLERFLTDVSEKTGTKQLHIIAHSMGNRAMLGAIERIALKSGSGKPMFGQIVMAAPDVDTSEFHDRFSDVLPKVCRQATLYTSGTDRALIASKNIHGYQRLGLSTSPLPTFSGIVTVDVSPVDTSLLGHSYYGSHPLLIKDLLALVELGAPPTMRSWLTNFTSPASAPAAMSLGNYQDAWRFRTELATEKLPIQR